MNVFISYSHKNQVHAKRIAKDLTDQGLTVWIDDSGIKYATPNVWLQQIDKALYEADFVIGIITNEYLNSTGAIEGFATIAKNIKEDNSRFIPLFFEDEKNIKSTLIPSFQGFMFYKDYDRELENLLKYLKEKQGETPSEILSKIESPDFGNPFYRVRTELFGDDYSLIARAFAEPEITLYEKIQGLTPVYLFGGRGVGKTMLLKSLLPDVICTRKEVATFAEIKRQGINFFGFYFRLQSESLLNHGYEPILRLAIKRVGVNFDYEEYKQLFHDIVHLSYEDAVEKPIVSAALTIMQNITLNELNYKIIKTIIENLRVYSNSSLLDIKAKDEKEISIGISKLLVSEQELCHSFEELLAIIQNQVKKILKYTQGRVLTDEDEKPDWIKTDTGFIGDTLSIIKQYVADFHDTNFYLLFDEFENLMPVQQTIINNWVKVAKNYTVKISCKFEGMYTNETLQNNQPIQFYQDCPEVKLDYDLSDDSIVKSYKKILVEICSNILNISGYETTQISNLLEEPPSLELPQDVIDKEIKNTRISGGLAYDETQLTEYRSKLSEAAIYRLLNKKEMVKGRSTRQKEYCGFDTFTYLSSGIIRAFLNLLGAAIYKAEQEGMNIKKGEKIPVNCQTWAATTVSKAWLERVRTIHDMGQQGEKTYQLIRDIGSVFRERLLKHSTEPETLTIAIADPLNINNEANWAVREIFSKGTKESVFYRRTSGMKPKNSDISEMREYILNRIYSPALKISYRSRWPRACSFTVSDIKNLLDTDKRLGTRRRIIKKQSSSKNHQESSLFDNMEHS